MALRENEHPVWNAKREILRIFSQLGAYISGNEPSFQVSRIMVTLNQLLLTLLELLRSEHFIRDRSLTSRRRTVELFLRELRRSSEMQVTTWTLDDMAEHCGMGRSAFSTYCHELTNTTPIDYLNPSCIAPSRSVRKGKGTHLGRKSPFACLACIAGVRIFGPNFMARWWRRKL
ncbi:MAG: AraC family transcriptional regulator [Verrucomicrobia bacterium]|jgi:AraC-like DNA-binding protein|nr:AraC family transcriptional regulator [Verrucomicrobiota bacterium]